MFKRVLILALFFGVLTLDSLAGRMVSLSIDELTQRADIILQGTVVSKACERHPRGFIITRVRVDVAEVFKGAVKSNRFEIIYNGGVIGDIAESSSIQADYQPGEEVLTFLRTNEWGEAVTVGVVQGKFEIWKDPRTGEQFAHNPFHGVSKSAAARAPTSARLTLSELKHRAKGSNQ